MPNPARNKSHQPKKRIRYKGELGRPLHPGETPESKLPLLYEELGTSDPQGALLALAARHVRGFQESSHRVGGRKRLLDPVEEEFLYEAIEAIQAQRAAQGKKKLSVRRIVEGLAADQPSTNPKVCKPLAGKSPKSLATFYSHREERRQTWDREFEKSLEQLRKLIICRKPPLNPV